MSTASDATAAHARALARSWRIAFVVYALAITVGTHWPRLQFGPEVPATDKTIHLLGFGGLAWLLWRTRWVQSRLAFLVVVVGWGVLDEASQALPVLGRSVSWHDVVANVLGVMLVAAWMWALAPVGGPYSRRRHALAVHAFDRLFVPRRTWLVLAGVGAGCLLPVVITRVALGATATGRAVIVAAMISLVAAAAIILDGWQREQRVICRQRRCFACGTAARDATFDELRETRCRACGGELHDDQWDDPPLASRRMRLRTAAPAVVLGLTVLAIAFIVLALVARVYAALLTTSSTSSIAARAARFVGTLPAPLTSVIDLAWALAVLALAVRIYRVRLARRTDSSRCPDCGHDLRGTPPHDGVVRCGECGRAVGRATAPANPAPSG